MAAVLSPLFFFFFFFLLLTLSSFSSPSFSLSDAEALLKLKQSFSNAAALSSWLPNSNPCSARWEGVFCNKNSVAGLRLSDMGLSGNIDIEALMEIKGLRTISLANNSFSGPIPDLHKLGVLKAIYLSDNQFSGTIPADFFSFLDSLKKVWLDRNKFTGNIPTSLASLTLVQEIHLENNEFSGPIPALKQDIKSLDMSNNKLQGPIPESLSGYGPDAFKGNDGLCGKPLEKPCEQVPPVQKQDKNKEPSHAIKVIMILACVIIVILLFVAIRSSRRRRDADFRARSRDSNGEMIQVRVASSTKNRGAEAAKKIRSSMRRGSTKKGHGDLTLVCEEKGMFGMQDLMKAAAEVLGNGALGSAYKAALVSGLCVVVKRMRDVSQIGRSSFDTKLRAFGKLKHPNVLTPLAYHFRKEEKLIVSEYVPKGSLKYVLHGDRGTNHSELTWPIRLRIIKGVGRGLGYLHAQFPSHDLPHGNLKSSNVLLSHTYDPLLSDFAFLPLLNPNAVQSLFAFNTPDFIQYQKVTQKTDVYCLGVIVLEVITGKFPSQYHSTGKGGTDVVQWVLTAISERREAEVVDPQIGTNSKSLDQMLKLVQIGAACTESNPEQRIHLGEAIRRIEEVHE